MTVNASTCIGCEMCRAACPLAVPVFDEALKVAVKCDFCHGEPECVKHCSSRALWLAPREEALRVNERFYLGAGEQSMSADAVRRLLERRIPGARFTCADSGARRTCVSCRRGRSGMPSRRSAREPGTRFMTLTAVDRGTDIDLLYHISLRSGVVTLRVAIRRRRARSRAIADLVPAAELIEKEVAELFGVEFAGHPRAANLLLPDDWPVGKRPLRKPLVGSVIAQARITAENLVASGSSIGVARSSMARREKAGLPKVPPLVAADEDRLREFKEFVKRTGFDERAGFDWAKGKLRYK